MLAFYWTIDGPRIIQSFLLLIPQGQRESISELISSMESRVSFYIAGQGVLCLVIGILSLLAYLLIGLPNVLVLALIAGVMEAVPMVGPLLGAIPAALVALSIAPTKAGLGHHRYNYDSAVGKQPACAARHAEGGGGQSVRHPTGIVCL